MHHPQNHSKNRDQQAVCSQQGGPETLPALVDYVPGDNELKEAVEASLFGALAIVRGAPSFLSHPHFASYVDGTITVASINEALRNDGSNDGGEGRGGEHDSATTAALQTSIHARALVPQQAQGHDGDGGDGNAEAGVAEGKKYDLQDTILNDAAFQEVSKSEGK